MWGQIFITGVVVTIVFGIGGNAIGNSTKYIRLGRVIERVGILTLVFLGIWVLGGVLWITWR